MNVLLIVLAVIAVLLAAVLVANLKVVAEKQAT